MDVTHFPYIYKFSELKMLIQNSRSKNIISRKAGILHDFLQVMTYFSSPVSKECTGCFSKCVCPCIYNTPIRAYYRGIVLTI